MYNVIDEQYKELGKSGKIFNKNDIINELSSLRSDRDITIYNSTCEDLSKNIWLVHYITLSNNIKIYRTSIWRKSENIIRIIFHQASEYKEDINLNIC